MTKPRAVSPVSPTLRLVLWAYYMSIYIKLSWHQTHELVFEDHLLERVDCRVDRLLVDLDDVLRYCDIVSERMRVVCFYAKE